MNFIGRILAIAAVGIGLAACATAELAGEADTVEQAHFITVATFNEYDKVGAEIFNNPNTPDEVKVALNRARRVAIEALNVAHGAFTTYGEYKALLAESPDDAELAEKVIAALSVLNEKVVPAKQAVADFTDLIKSLD